MFWLSFTHCRQATVSYGLGCGLSPLQKCVWAYFYSGCTIDKGWTQSYHLPCLPCTFLFQVLSMFLTYWPVSIHISKVCSSTVHRGSVVGEGRSNESKSLQGNSRQALSPSPLMRPPSVSPPAHPGVGLVQPGYLCMQMSSPGEREPAATGMLFGNEVRTLEEGRLCSFHCWWEDDRNLSWRHN